MADGKNKPHSGQHAGEQGSKVKYTGPKLAVQALDKWNKAYVFYTLNSEELVLIASDDPRIGNIQDDAEVQAAGYVDGAFIKTHPPAEAVRSMVAQVQAFYKANRHTGGKGGKAA